MQKALTETSEKLELKVKKNLKMEDEKINLISQITPNKQKLLHGKQHPLWHTTYY